MRKAFMGIMWVLLFVTVIFTTIWSFRALTDPYIVEANEAAYGALFGAFFAVALGQLVGFIRHLAILEQRYHAKLAELDYVCNQLHNELNDAQYAAQEFISLLEKTSREQIFVWGKRFHSISNISEGRPHIKNARLLNEVLSVDITIDKLNNDSDMLNRVYEDLEHMRKEDKIDAELFFKNLERLSENATVYRNHIQYLRDSLKAVHAFVRVELQNVPFLYFVYRTMQFGAHRKRPTAKIISEISLLEKEMEQNRAESDSVIQKANTLRQSSQN